MRLGFQSFRCLLSILAVGIVLTAAASEPIANGVFLVASPDMGDPRFREAVVLVTQPEEGGPFGVIINRPLDRRLADVLPEYEALKSREDVVYYGGPVAPSGLLFLVRSTDAVPGATRVLADAWLLNDPEAVGRLLAQPSSVQRWRAYSGYAGWAPGQLQHEFARGGWRVLPADADTVFEKDAAAIWRELSTRAAIRRTKAAIGER